MRIEHNLPDLPQVRILDDIVSRLVSMPEVLQGWVGGSFATGTADRYSDLDLRISVKPDALSSWAKPDLARIFADPCPGSITMVDAERSVLHHVLLSSGELVDLFVQPFPPAAVEPVIVPIAYRTVPILPPECAQIEESQPFTQQPNKHEIEQALRGFWVNSHKHRKVLDRNLDLMAHIGLQFEKDVLRRLWLLDLTGQEDSRRKTIHTLTAQTALLTDRLGQHAFDVLGMPLQTRAQLVAAIEAIRCEVSDVGRRLAAKLEFEYPADLEEVVLSGWRVASKLKPTQLLSLPQNQNRPKIVCLSQPDPT